MAVDMFLKIDGVESESRDKSHAGEIDVLAWSWGLSQSGTMHVGGGGGAGKVNVQDISLTKWVDKASPNLFKACCNGKHFANAILTVRKAGESPVEYVVITMDSVPVTSVSTGGSGGEDRLPENITLHFAKVQVSYQPQKDDGSKDGGTIDMTWNIQENVE